jgi:hypothetical protein
MDGLSHHYLDLLPCYEAGVRSFQRPLLFHASRASQRPWVPPRGLRASASYLISSVFDVALEHGFSYWFRRRRLDSLVELETLVVRS